MTGFGPEKLAEAPSLRQLAGGEPSFRETVRMVSSNEQSDPAEITENQNFSGHRAPE
jgi:hypothetical protein